MYEKQFSVDVTHMLKESIWPQNAYEGLTLTSSFRLLLIPLVSRSNLSIFPLVPHQTQLHFSSSIVFICSNSSLSLLLLAHWSCSHFSFSCFFLSLLLTLVYAPSSIFDIQFCIMNNKEISMTIMKGKRRRRQQLRCRTKREKPQVLEVGSIISP